MLGRRQLNNGLETPPNWSRSSVLLPYQIELSKDAIHPTYLQSSHPWSPNAAYHNTHHHVGRWHGSLFESLSSDQCVLLALGMSWLPLIEVCTMLTSRYFTQNGVGDGGGGFVGAFEEVTAGILLLVLLHRFFDCHCHHTTIMAECRFGSSQIMDKPHSRRNWFGY